MTTSHDSQRPRRKSPSGVFPSVRVSGPVADQSVEETLSTSRASVDHPAEAMRTLPHNDQHARPTTSADVVIVVAEKGTGWTRWAERYQARGQEVIAVVQSPDESIQALSSRLRLRLRSLLEEGVVPAEAVLVSAQRRDAKAMGVRSTVIRHLVGSMAEAGAGRVWLDGKDRFAAMALASTVAPLIRGTGVSVRPTGPAALVA